MKELLKSLNWIVAPPSTPVNDGGDEGEPSRKQIMRVANEIDNQNWMIEFKKWKSSYTISDLCRCGESRAIVEWVVDEMRRRGCNKALKYLVE